MLELRLHGRQGLPGWLLVDRRLAVLGVHVKPAIAAALEQLREDRVAAWIDKMPNESCAHLPARLGFWCKNCQREFKRAVARAQDVAVRLGRERANG